MTDLCPRNSALRCLRKKTKLSRQFIVRDHDDRTPLHMAAVNGSERCVEYILQTHPESLNALDKHQVQCRTHLL